MFWRRCRLMGRLRLEQRRPAADHSRHPQWPQRSPCWEVTRPLPSYDLGQAIKSLSLNKDGDRLAVNQFVCSVVGEGDAGPQLAAWERLPTRADSPVRRQGPCWAVQLTDRSDGKQRNLRQDKPLFGANVIGFLGSSMVSGPLPAISVLSPRPVAFLPIITFETELRQLTAPRAQGGPVRR